MANFEAYQEYQRIEDYEEDSPPGEEDLLVHVPEGLKGKHGIPIRKHIFFKKRCLMHIRSLRNNQKKPRFVSVKLFWVCGYLMFSFCCRLMAPYQELG